MHVVCSIQCSFLIAQYDSYSPDHSFLSGSFILHFKPFLGHFIIPRIKIPKNFFRSTKKL